ncbi:hypothetical protein ACFL1H_02965 [Nanoarchaeota archaeon]
MRITSYAPEYNGSDVFLKQDPKGLNIEIDKYKRKFQPEDIAVTVLGEVESFKINYSEISEIIDNTVTFLDTIDELKITTQQFVTYGNLKDGKKFIGELEDFEGSNYNTKCNNPMLDTDIVKELEKKKVVFIAGLLSDRQVQQYAESLNNLTMTGKLGLEKIIVIDGCTNTVGEDRSDRDILAKYNMEQQGIVIGTIYRGSTKIV